MGNPTDNPILVKRAKKEADKDPERKKERFIKTVRALLFSKKKAMHTDIMSSLNLAEKIFRTFQRDKSILVIFSDMIEDSSRYNFEREKLTDKRIEEIIREEKIKNRMPYLKDVEVYVVAAASIDPNKFFTIQKFWLRYFKECGADISKENYTNTLLKLNE